VSPESASQVQLVPVTMRILDDRVTATAEVQPNQRAVAQITTRVPARVVSLIADPGQEVKAGESLAILSSGQLGEAKAEYLKRRALMKIAGEDLVREEALNEQKISPMKDLLAARANYESTKAQFEMAREILRVMIPADELARLDWTDGGSPLDDFPLTSPIAGTLVKRTLTIGAPVNPDDEPLVVMNLDEVWVIANIFEHDIASVHPGEKALVTVDAYPNHPFEGEVSNLSDLVDQNTRTVQARVVVANPGHLLKPGMFANVEIEAPHGARSTLTVSSAAIFTVDGHSVAFALVGNSSFEMRRLVLGQEGGGYVEVISGLKEGEQVSAVGGLMLKSLMVNGAEG
jgi:membrane fusion protein, heavy metal efflux system